MKLLIIVSSHTYECVVTKGCVCYLVVLYFSFPVVLMSFEGFVQLLFPQYISAKTDWLLHMTGRFSNRCDFMA